MSRDVLPTESPSASFPFPPDVLRQTSSLKLELSEDIDGNCSCTVEFEGRHIHCEVTILDSGEPDPCQVAIDAITAFRDRKGGAA